jgi:hypothetical protein
MTYEKKWTRISEQERMEIPQNLRCWASYNGYHTFEIIRPMKAEQNPFMVCKKCCEKVMLFDEATGKIVDNLLEI